MSQVNDYIQVSKEKPMSLEQWGKAANIFIQVTPMKAGTVVTKTATGITSTVKAANKVKWTAGKFAEGKLDSHFQKHVINRQEWSDLGYSLTKAGLREGNKFVE
ncbi:hypothetical protein [Cohnella phaseoli]|uniref:hypothetical protein n=1 Tax=Cohnella phaseoli TaxID=456490 RepID=UPI000E27D4E9|nr:hypothetical protein [Cohnella phaseoli]